MSVNVCSITGQPLMQPVISRKTGHLYEKAVIEKHLAAFPYCPVTNTPMTVSDLLQIAQPEVNLVKGNESAQVFMTKLRNQYDTLVLETHYLREALRETKQQLMHSVYQNEAAQRVIAKLIKEKAETEAQIVRLSEAAQ